MAVIAATALALAAWVAGPANAIAAGLLIAAGALQFVRLVRWAGMKALSDPLVFVLHLSYAWLPTGFVLLGCTMLHPLLPVSSAVQDRTSVVKGKGGSVRVDQGGRRNIKKKK